MPLIFLTLFSGLFLSLISAYYSIAGLMAIFSAAPISILVMGVGLEVAKIVTTVWLKIYWAKASLWMKSYLTTSVVILMLITSIGCFGYLSKAHLDQAVPTGEVAAQVALIDEKIANERETIANARSLLGQLDKAVTDISNAPDREVNGRVISSAERALQVRRQQAADRARLTRTIEDAQSRIIKLQEQKAPIASQLREVEAKVGPIKYIAALIYGDNPDANLLERAVRYMIILLVAVFDPLAIMMLLAFTESYRWHRGPRQMFFAEPAPLSEPEPTTEKSKEHRDDTEHIPSITPTTDMVGERDSVSSIPEPVVPPQPTEPEPDPGPVIETPRYRVLDDADDEEPLSPAKAVPEIRPELRASEPFLYVDPDLQQNLTDPVPIIAAEASQKLPEFDFSDDAATEEEIEEFQKDLTSNLHFGPMFPGLPKKGDLFLKINTRPTTLFKFNGDKWITVNKGLTDRYAFNDQYIDWLITEISIGKYDADLLTDLEREQIRQRLQDKEA